MLDKKSVIYFVPVKKEFLNKWVYYNVDHEVLKEIYDRVYVCSNLFELIKKLFLVNDIYCWWWNRSLLVILLSRLLNKRVITTGAIHMFDYSGSIDYYKKSLYYRVFTKWALKFSNINIFISNDQLNSVTSHIKVNKPRMVHSSLNKDQKLDQNQINRKIALANESNKLRLFSIVWLTKDQIKRKALIEILHSLKIFNQNYNGSWEWVLAGKQGNGVHLIQKLISELKLNDNVKLMLDIDEKTKNLLYYNSDLLLMPSWFEGFGNSVLEAMSFGTSSLVSRYGASPEVIGDSGLIINQITSKEICKKLLFFAHLSKKEQSKLISLSFSRAYTKFSFDSRKENLLKILNEKT
jgi:glycosyltransferase involved in cell wall biosynthesis